MIDQPGNDHAQFDRAPEPRITVVGVGRAGGNAINNMIRANLEGVEFLVANTDAQALEQSLCEIQIQLGASLTKGLGAGSRPEIGQVAAEEATEAIVASLKGSNMAFITAGMGGGTGTGSAPVIARAAREEGVLTVGVVTKPFAFEGAHRMRQAEAGIAELAQYVDTLIVIPNQNLFLVADEKTTFADAFKLADEVLHSGVRGVTDLMVLPGLVNLDFADVRSIMAGMGKAVMGTGEAEGGNRALEAAEAAISNSLLGDVSMKGARSVLINITGGPDLMLMEVDEAANRIREEVDPDANIIFGSAFNENFGAKIRVSVIATGKDLEPADRLTPKSNGPFVSDQAENRDEKRATQVHAGGTVEQMATPEEPARDTERRTVVETTDGLLDSPAPSAGKPPIEEPLTLRLVSTLQTNDKEPEASPSVSIKQESTPRPLDAGRAETKQAEAGPADTAAQQSDTVLSTDAEGTRFIWEHDQETDAADGPNNLTNTHEPAPGLASHRTPEKETTGELKPKFHRSAKPVKSESTLEAYEKDRRQEDSPEPAAEKMHYVVWEVDSGARLNKITEGKLAAVRNQPHARLLKTFDNLDKAKAEANAIFKRVNAERAARGLPGPISEPTLEDLLRWEEMNVPHYIL